MLVAPKPHRTLRGALSLCFKNHCNSGDNWTNEENMTYPSIAKPVMCLNLLGAPGPCGFRMLAAFPMPEVDSNEIGGEYKVR